MKTSFIQGILALALVWSGMGCGQEEKDRPRSRVARPSSEGERRGSQISAGSGRSLMISEFMAINDSVLRDDQGEFSDWIEILNYGAESTDLSGWSLTDDPVDLEKWQFPPRSIGPGESHVFFASGRGDESGLESHCSFRLSAEGEFLGLVSPEGHFVHQFATRYPVQRRDLSYGIASDWRVGLPPADFEGFFERPTPGGSNAALLIGQVEPITFNHPGGVIENGLQLEMASKTAGSRIYFSLDGRFPSQEQGQRYERPIRIKGDVVVRAQAVKPGYQSSPIAVQSFVIVQESRKKGQALQRSDLGLPIVSLSIESGENPNQVEKSPLVAQLRDEQGVRFEWIDPEGEGWQVGCGIRARDRNEDSKKAKPALRLYFRDQYGPAQFKRSLFGLGSASRFDRLELIPVDRSEPEARLWDRFCQDLMGAMRQPFVRGRFCHVFLNSGYLGVYELRERIDLDFAKSYFGGAKSQIDLVESRAKPGDTERSDWYKWIEGEEEDWVRWASVVESGLVRASSTPTGEWRQSVEFDNFVSFAVLSWFKNGMLLPDSLKWVAIRSRVGSDGFRFLFETNPGRRVDAGSGLRTSDGGELLAFWNYLVQENAAQVRDQVSALFAPGGALALKELELRVERFFSVLDSSLGADRAKWMRSDSENREEAKQVFLSRVRERRQQLLAGLAELGLVEQRAGAR